MTEALLATTPAPVPIGVGAHVFHLVPIPGGTFDMGDEAGDLWEACRPVHPVRLDDFCLGQFSVTQALWRAVVESMPGDLDPDPSFFKGDNRPVERVSWEDVRVFLEKLNALSPGRGFRLPTEAEWEYAARAVSRDLGGGTACLYAGSNRLESVAWWDGNSNGESKPVGLKLPNALGLFDMSGNVYEWCEDWLDGKFYEKCRKQGALENPLNTEKGSNRVVRGGSWFSGYLRYCRVADRGRGYPTARGLNVGFRLAASPPSQWRG